MDGWRQALTSAIEGIPQDVTPKAIRQVFNAGIKARQPAKPAERGYEIPILLNTPAFVAAWGDYEQHRREKGKKLTPLAARNQLKALDAMGEARAIAAIHHSIGNGWTGIFEPKMLQVNEAAAKPMPLFKQIEIIKGNLGCHPCNPRSIFYDPDAYYLKGDYTDLKAKLAALEQEQRKQVLG